MKRKFWNWIQNQDESELESRTLFLNGEISDETSYGDEVTPKLFKDELNKGKGSISFWINSPGGDVFAAAQIYNMLMDYPYDVTVKIDGLAASAASVIAMAGTTVEMSPVAMMMIHNPATIAIGDSEEMKKAVKMLDEVKESIMNASLVAGTPDTILGRPVKTSAFMPTAAAGAKTIAFGDFKYYWIADRQGRTFKKLSELYAANGQVGFMGTQRVDGKLILPEAIKVLQMKSGSAS